MILTCNELFIFATVAIASAVADTDIYSATTTIKEGVVYCPVPAIGTRCPDGSIFHYYKCCGDLFKDCCINLQVWVIVVLALIALMIVASFVASVLRCIFCLN